jgi:DNA polymerase III subunit gamma/tau
VPTASASLYRRHRPRTFADVVGQDHVVRTLRNAIEQDKVHHAYLFVGSRGTGKTSMAKILAASLNCVNGPTVSPCGQCESCRGIAQATSLDVIEMDAASNNSVDDIRDLRERVNFAPVGGHSKVYILDEAHMLTTAAWNAFLKTLEEPPPNTIFVLATTEANKVLPTVVDRCHRFDFARPSVPQIAEVLHRVAASESIEIGDEAVALVARAATGSFRDALGTLEQLLAYSGNSISLEDVLAVLGAADADLVFGTVDAIAGGSPRDALLAAARLADSGRDIGRFFGDLEAHARGLMVVQTLGEVPAELRVTTEQDERLAEQAKRVGPADVVRLLELLSAGLRAMKDGADARTQLELALVKAAAPERDAGTTALLARIERLEAQLAGGAPPRPAPAAPASAPRAPSEPVTAAGRAARPAPPEVAPAPEAAVAAAVAVVEPDGPQPQATAAAVSLSLDSFSRVWPAVLERLASESPMLAGALRDARPAALGEEGLTIAWPEAAALTKRQAEDPAKQEMLAQAIRAVTGASLRLAHEVRAAHEVPDAPAAAAEPKLSDDELVERFMAEFDAEELPPEQPQPPSQES